MNYGLGGLERPGLGREPAPSGRATRRGRDADIDRCWLRQFKAITFMARSLWKQMAAKTNGPGLQSTRAVVNTIWRWCSVHGTPGGAERLIKLAWAGMPKNAGGIVRRALGAGSSNGWQTMAKQT